MTAKQSYGLTFHMEETKAEIKQGGSRSLSIRLTNTGNGEDTFKFTSDGTDKAWVLFKKDSVTLDAGETKEMTVKLREEYKITDMKLLKVSLVVLGATIFLFSIHGALQMEPSIAALAGAAALLVIAG